MTTRILSCTISLAGAVAMLAAVACTDDNSAYAKVYCDGSVCYQCDGNDQCVPLPNKQCVADAACKSDERCTNIGCAKLCKSDLACGEGTICVTGYCAPPPFAKIKPKNGETKRCADDKACAVDEYCGGTGTCQIRCKSDDQCGPDKVCASCGKCQPKTRPATCGENRVFCSANISCKTGKSCLAGRCHFQCTDSSTCPAGQACTDNLCRDDLNPAKPECALDLQCNSGACINGTCRSACKTSATCGSGTICTKGLCRPDYHPAAS